MNMHIPLRVLQEGEEAAVSSFSPAQDSAVLADNHGRRFSYLRLSITDVCNFRCNYCLPDGYQGTDRSGFLTLEEIRRIAAAFAAMGTRKIRITGGEPSLRKDLPDVIRTLKQTPGIETVALTSNGYRLTQQIRDWADAGLDQLNVSIDSLDPQQFKAITGHDKLQEILDGIQLARELGIRHIKVNAVLLKAWNMNSFQHFFDWLRTTPVTLRFIELMETGDNGEFFAANHVSGDSVKQTLLSRGWTEKPRGPHDGPAQEFSHPDFAGDIGLTNKRLFAITGSHCINHVFRAEHGGITALPCAQENAAGALNRDFLDHGLSELAELAAFHLPATSAGNFGEFTPALLGKAGILKKHLVRRLG